MSRPGEIIKFVGLLILLFLWSESFSQKLRVIGASNTIADTRIGNELRKSSWNIDPTVRPDIYDAYVPQSGKSVTFITNEDSISFHVIPGGLYEFVILINGKDSAFTAIKGILDTPRAQFSDIYKKEHTGKTFVEIPAMYELMNVVISLTTEGKKDNGLIRKDNPYYHEVLQWFDKFKTEPVVAAVNKEIANPENYHALKMDAYAFNFQERQIVQSPVYDRIGFSNTNNIRLLIPLFQDFANKSGFIDFYSAHQNYYDRLIVTYRDSIGIAGMQTWLTTHFPSTKYDSFKIIFSPLVSSNQSATWFDYDGFKEAQAHVNFPFRKKNDQQSLSEQAMLVRDGNIVFTELNHAFINPESEKPAYTEKIAKAFKNLTVWNDPQKPARYYNDAFSSFNEYMNWALVCLRYVDFAPKKEQKILISQTETMMVESRGFTKFAEFDRFLIPLYIDRKKGQILADLYPEIVSWFEENSKISVKK